MRWAWPGRWAGVACCVAGCMPMLFALLAGAAGAAGATTMGSMSSMVVAGPAAAPVEPGWVKLLGDASWPLFLVSALLLVWSFWRARTPARLTAYAGVAVLVANQIHMVAWLFLPGMALVGAGLVVAAVGAQRGRSPQPLQTA